MVNDQRKTKQQLIEEIAQLHLGLQNLRHRKNGTAVAGRHLSSDSAAGSIHGMLWI